MNKEDRQRGPIAIFSCKGCTELKTHCSEHQSHHQCKEGYWVSIEHTPIAQYPMTPSECRFITE